MLDKLLSLVGLCTISQTRDDAPVRVAQVRLNEVETKDQTPLLQGYGFSSRPHPGAQAVYACLAGDRARMVIIETHDQRYFVTLAEGEACMHDDLGRKVWISRSGIVVDGNGSPVTVKGDLHVTGAVIAGYGGTDQVGLQTHVHVAPEHAGNTTAPTAGT